MSLVNLRALLLLIARVARRLLGILVWRLRGRHGLHWSVRVSRHCMLARDVKIGANSFVNRGCYVSSSVTLGRFVMLGPGVKIVGDDHDIDNVQTPMAFTTLVKRPTTVEDDVWIGADAIVMAGVRIKRGAVVAANAVVMHDVEPGMVVAGVPASIVRPRFRDQRDFERHLRAVESAPTGWRAMHHYRRRRA